MFLPEPPSMTPEQWNAHLDEVDQQIRELSKQVQPPTLDKYYLLDWSFEAVRWQKVQSWMDRGVCLDTYLSPTSRGIAEALNIKPTRVRNAVARLGNQLNYPTHIKPIEEAIALHVIPPTQIIKLLIDLAERKPRVQTAINIVLAVRNRWNETGFNF